MEAISVMGYDNANWGAGEWLAMIGMMVLFWGVLIALVVWAVRSFRPRESGTNGLDPVDVVLTERYARGEIDEDELRRRRAALRATSSP